MTSVTGNLNAFIDSNQNIYACGEKGDYFGQNPELFKTNTLMGNQKWKKVSVGDNFMAGIREDNTLWVIGLNSYGRLGANESSTNIAINQWTQIGKDRKWIDVSCGSVHMIAIDEYNKLWGAGVAHQLYNGITNEITNVSTTGISLYGCLLGTMDKTKYIELTELTWINDIKYEKVYCATNRNYVMSTTGNVYAFGLCSNSIITGISYNSGDFISPTNNNPHMFFTNNSNKGGYYYYINNVWSKFVAVPIMQHDTMTFLKVEAGYSFAYALGTDNYLYYQGIYSDGSIPSSNYKQLIKETSTTNKWKDFSCGGYHVMAIAEDGSLWGRGNNLFGQLGDGTKNKRTEWTKISSEQFSAVYCGSYYTTAIKEDGTIWSCGINRGDVISGSTNNPQITLFNGTPENVDAYKCAENYVTKKYIVNQKAVFTFTVDPIKKLYSIIPKGSFPANTHFLMQFSDDGSTWKTYDEVNEEWTVAQSNDEGITPEQIDSIVDDKMSWLSDKQFYIKGIMWTENEDVSVIFNGFDAKLYMNLNSPEVASVNISAIKSAIDKADFSINRDGSTNYKAIKEDQVKDISMTPEGNYIKLKADLEPGQTIDAISYSYE